MKIINVGNRINNNYLIQLDNGYLLIDTGYQEQFIDFCKRLRRHNIELKDISYIFLTHAHDDHAGFLNEILDNCDARIILHRKAVERLKEGKNSFEGGCTSYLALTFCRIMKLLGKGDHRFQPVDRKNRYIILDEVTQPILEKELRCRIINLPGHTIDSIGLFFQDGSLFCGDAVMNGFPSMNRIIIWIENLKDYMESWESMINYNPIKIYPSHGNPFLKRI
ncbi:MBL fold metallo-hydrolase [Oceanirhabdus sp. W0125-5]|uniref:MBL fold metallo-hydrolase n=1 Tax=Oceanirhabdus sp. W0125-5 TaxID=2999116 RepID=UPI0022F322A8|nr:MBL fold metallo-hydrolase [Oceanirhabdus sp. W0125-5]WBW95055.1 MBL fold metallo-hydrolase [Oceanirhabdus sp. W0125-5]